MPAVPIVRCIEFVSPGKELTAGPGGTEVRVRLEDGSCSTFGVMIPEHVRQLLNESGKDYRFGHPVLFMRRLDQETLAQAIGAMAADMSGFWLRYYNTAAAKGPRSSEGRRSPFPKTAAAKKSGKTKTGRKK